MEKRPPITVILRQSKKTQEDLAKQANAIFDVVLSNLDNTTKLPQLDENGKPVLPDSAK